MKHIKKFEDKELKKTEEYLNRLFKDMNPIIEFYPTERNFEIKIKDLEISGREFNHNEYFEEIKNLYDFHSNLKDILQSLSDDYKKVTFYLHEEGENNAWVNTIKRIISIEVYI